MNLRFEQPQGSGSTPPPRCRRSPGGGMRRFQNPPPAPSHQAALLGWIKARFVDAHAPGAPCGSAGGGSWGSGAHSPSSLGTQDTSTFFAAVWMLRPCAGWGAHPGDLPGQGQACGVASASRESAQHLSPRILSAEGGQRGRKPPSPTPRRSSAQIAVNVFSNFPRIGAVQLMTILY